MNLRKIKLALTVGMINRHQHISLPGIRQMMSNIKEAGAFVSQVLVNNQPIHANLTKETYAIHFENCTLDVNFFKNPATNSWTVQGFEIR